MNDTFLNTLLELSEEEKRSERRPTSGIPTRPSSVLFSRPPSSILMSRPPSAAFFGRPASGRKQRRPPSTSTLRPRPPSGGPHIARAPSVSTIASVKPVTVSVRKRPNSMKCSVCTEGFRFPNNTPCFDNYCVKCLEDHILSFRRGTSCDCPLCKCGILLPLSKTISDTARYQGKLAPISLTVCNVCSESRLAQYRCNSCEEHFCEKCNKDFLKRMRIDSHFNTSSFTDITAGDHAIPAITAKGLDDESFDSISLPSLLPKGFGLRCPDHEEEELRFHCKDCDKAMCRDCKLLYHEGHPTLPIEDVYEDRKQHLSQAVKLTNANIRKLHAEVSEINSKRLEIDQESRDAVSEIENHANEAKRIIDELSKSMIKTIRNQNTQSRGKLEQSRDIVKENVKALQGYVEEANKYLESENCFDIIDKGPKMTKAMNETDVSPTAERQWRKRYVFQAADILGRSAGQLFGRLQTIVQGLVKEVPCVELEMQSTFNSDIQYKSTTALAPLSDGTVWVCNGFRNKIHRHAADGQLIQSETLHFDVDDMVDGLTDKIFFTEVNGKVIRKLHGGKLTVFARADLYLRGLTVSKDDNYIISCGNDVPIACLREAAVSKIYVYSMQGKPVKEILVDVGTKGVSLFRICHTINDEYIVSTGISALYYIIGENGELKYRYQTSTSADGVASDSHGLIYLSACRDDTLYILDCKGVPIPSTYAMHKPTAVAIDRKDTIWVGDWSKVHVLNYKL
ncbi:uncharacterized protein LOC128214937 [Mya arenaria]|uniref:uncharacterized protein LOC128214937 n=1 Tax=Mya arenaria TaxID=6604 RepID=UPI0022E1200A|nr:uncharacterized protein LOC128214937 [Mya arenaria]